MVSFGKIFVSALLFSCCDAFIPQQPCHHQSPALYKSLITSDIDNEVVYTPPKRPDYPLYSAAEITQAQNEAENRARNAFDMYAMNALFVNIEERAKPLPCSISSDSPSLTLPSDLSPGCLLRIGPNGANKKEGFLDGDGMVHAITLPPPGEERRDIMYSATYVDTNGRKLERNAGNGEKFAGTLGAAPYGLPMLAGLLNNGLTFKTLDVQKDTCNTAIAVSGSRILALMEQAPPSEIAFDKGGNMRTVESFARLDGAVPKAPINGGNLGAHGRTDSTTGERVHVSYQSNSRPYVRVDTFTDDWKLKSTIGVDVPTPVMVHDLALTPTYTVIFDFPLTVRPQRFLSNAFPVEYEPQNGARIGLTPRGRTTDDTIWFDVECGVVLHAVNAYERDDGMVVLHAFNSIPDPSSSYILEYTPAFLYEWVLDPKTGTVVSERCMNPDVCVEFPICHISGERTPTTYGLITTGIGGPLLEFSTPQSGVTLDGVVEFALEDDGNLVAGDVANRYDLPAGWHFVSEPTTVDKTSGDGHYLLVIATYVPPVDENYLSVAKDGQSMKSQLLILDGECISNGPVTIVDLPKHVNYGLHSEFVDWDILE